MNKETIVCGVQQVGVGVFDVVEAYNWYIKAFGCDIMVTDAKGIAERMLPYTGGKPRPRRAVLAMNIQGGGGFEVWQPLDGNITPPAQPARLGDLGISACKVKTIQIESAFSYLKALEGVTILTNVKEAPYGSLHFYMTDPYGNIFEIVEDSYVFQPQKGYVTGGTHGAVIGVTDMERSIGYYRDLLGYDKVLYDGTDLYKDFKGVPGGESRFRRVLLGSSAPLRGAFSDLYGTSCIELVQALDFTPVKIFDGRWWGDPGFIQICFDVVNMDGMRERVKALGQDFVCDSGTDFQMSGADGHFTYVEDPDGTLIELVETFRVPVHKKLGIYLELRKRDASRKLPRWFLKAVKRLRGKGISN